MFERPSQKYHAEILEIETILNQLKDGKYYENSQVKMHGSLNKNLDHLELCLLELMHKIDTNSISRAEYLRQEISKLENI